MQLFKKSCQILIFLLLSSQSLACPSWLFLHNNYHLFAKSSRNHLGLFILKKGEWIQVPLQIDPLSEQGKIEFYNPGFPWEKLRLHPRDRLVFETLAFGSRFIRGGVLPCKSDFMVEIKSMQKVDQYGYLVDCKQDVTLKGEQVLIHNTHLRSVKGKDFEYKYSIDNHLTFDSIKVSSSKDLWYEIAKEADQLIRGDVQNFFTLNFSSDDFEARIDNERQTNLGIVGRLSFFLHLLFFKVDLRLSPEVSFYKESMFMPMVMSLPINAPEYLNSGSGLFYTWKSSDLIKWSFDKSNIAQFNSKKLSNSKLLIDSVIKDYCNNQICHYNIWGSVKGVQREFMLEFNIPLHLVKRGFYPQLIKSVALEERNLNWNFSRYNSDKRMGVYFEASGLPAGDHNWEFWIRFIKPMEINKTKICPEPVYASILWLNQNSKD